MPVLKNAIDTVRRALAAELADMRIAHQRFERTLARAERTYESLSDLAEQLASHGCRCLGHHAGDDAAEAV